VQEPYEGCSDRSNGLAYSSGSGQAKADRDAETHPVGGGGLLRRVAISRFGKRVSGDPPKCGPRSLPDRPGREKPHGSSRRSADSTSVGREGLSEGSKPRNRGPSVRLGVFVESNGGRKR
jgi:hypothetical protein